MALKSTCVESLVALCQQNATLKVTCMWNESLNGIQCHHVETTESRTCSAFSDSGTTSPLAAAFTNGPQIWICKSLATSLDETVSQGVALYNKLAFK